MTENKNIQLIKEHFASFGRGDLDSALEMVAEIVDWQSPVTRSYPKEITWAKPRKSREEVKQFFQEMADRVQPEKFEIFGFIAMGNKVVVEGRNKGHIKSTNRGYEHDWIMVFTLHEGKIVRHRHYYDTADIKVAFQK